LGIAGEILVFLKQLGGITTGSVVNATAIALIVRASALALLPATAATAAGLTIVHQGLVVLSLQSRPSIHRGSGCRVTFADGAG
jgi:hypothetical protein